MVSVSPLVEVSKKFTFPGVLGGALGRLRLLDHSTTGPRERDAHLLQAEVQSSHIWSLATSVDRLKSPNKNLR